MSQRRRHAMDEAIAQFVAVTSADADTARQYLEASDYNLEPAVELFFAAGAPEGEPVRERIEGFEDQLVDDMSQYYNELARDTRRAEARARKPRGVFNQVREGDLADLSRHEKRLATLFRPPFDIITEAGFDDAKAEAQEVHKMLMVNVQDVGQFVCQQLNRDLFRNVDVKRLIDKYFVFVQYDVDEPDGEEYRILYPFEMFPHIAIIDPWTGEQQRVWDKVPTQQEFIADVKEYLAHRPQDVEHITRERDEHDIHEILDESESDEELADHDEEMEFASPGEEASESSAPETAQEPAQAGAPGFALPALGDEPAGPGTTRVQFKFADGSRAIRRFLLGDSVKMLYAFVRTRVDGEFTLTNGREELKTEVEKSIQEAGLPNSTILVEQV